MTVDPRSVSVFAPSASRRLGEAVCHALDLPLAPLEERDFDDGEHKARPLESVRGRDVYAIASLYDDAALSPADKLCRLLFLIGALRDASAERVTAVVPYLCYARQERRAQLRDPVTTRYVATMFEAAGADRVVTVDVHERAAYENAFRIRAEHLEARPILVEHVAARVAGDELAVVSPDPGGVGRAARFREALEQKLRKTIEPAFMEKVRAPDGVRGAAFAGNVAGRTAVIVDDVAATGTTLIRTAEACRAHGAAKVIGAVTHGVFAGDAGKLIAGEALDWIAITNTVEPWRLAPELLRDKVEVLDIAPLLARAVRHLHEGSSLAALDDLP